MVGPVRQMLPQSPHRRCESVGFDITDVVEGKKVPDVRGLLPWLSKPVRCECGAYCEADTDYVHTQAMIVDIWRCPDCGNRYYREADDLTGPIR